MSEESVFHAIVQKDTLKTYAETVNSLVDECKLHVSGGGFHVSAVDPSNVAMIDRADLSPRAFEAFDSPGRVTQGINLIRLLDYIGHAGTDELIDLNLNMETRKLEIRYGSTEHSMGLIDPDAIRTEPDEPDLDLHNTAVVEGGDLKQAVEEVGLSAEHVYVRGNVDDRQIEFYGQGDVDDTTVAYGDEEVLDASVSKDAESIFSLEFLDVMTDPIPTDAAVTLRFDEEHPLRIAYEAAGGAMDVQMTLAPRIQST